MQRVKNYMKAYKSYAKSEKSKLEEMKKDNMYSQDYIADQEKRSNQALDIKRQEYLKEMNGIIDGKLASIKRPDMSSAEYQAAVSNILTKVQLLGSSLNAKLLKEIIAPAVEKQDNSTIAAVRSYITDLPNFPGGEPRKREVLEGAPRVINQADILEDARLEINRVFNDHDFVSGTKGAIAMEILEQTGTFDL